jgi:GT2 family glycosyltransferase
VKIAAVIVTYNRKELLDQCIGHVLAQKDAACDILVIDNHSTDGTKDRLQPYIDAGRIDYTDTGSNLGGAGGFSYGIRRAAEKGYDRIWIMDDDCMPEKDALAALLQADRDLNGDYGFLSSRVLWKDGSLCTMNLQRETLTKNLKGFEKRLQPVAMASFVSLFLKRETVMELGLPIKEFYIWTDDWEYTRRISRKYPCYAVADSTVVHLSKSNIGANIATASAERLNRFDYLYRNDVFLYRREGLRGLAYEALRLSGHSLRVLLRAEDHRKERLQKIILGTLKGFSFHPTIEMMQEEKDP